MFILIGCWWSCFARRLLSSDYTWRILIRRIRKCLHQDLGEFGIEKEMALQSGRASKAWKQHCKITHWVKKAVYCVCLQNLKEAARPSECDGYDPFNFVPLRPSTKAFGLVNGIYQVYEDDKKERALFPLPGKLQSNHCYFTKWIFKFRLSIWVL